MKTTILPNLLLCSSYGDYGLSWHSASRSLSLYWALLPQSGIDMMSPGMGAGEQVCLGMYGRGWSGMSLVSERFLLPRTWREDGDKFRQNCALLFSWSLCCEAEHRCEGTGYLQLKHVQKVICGFHLGTAYPSSRHQLGVQC